LFNTNWRISIFAERINVDASKTINITSLLQYTTIVVYHKFKITQGNIEKLKHVDQMENKILVEYILYITVFNIKLVVPLTIEKSNQIIGELMKLKEFF
jgi:hypothetical protein